jgi:zinc/manganese transport system substrate-binding protein
MNRTCLFLGLIVSLLGSSAGFGKGKLQVVATLPELGDLARQVGGDQVEVFTIAKGTQDPHYLEAKPSFSVKLNRADLLIYSGLELEIGWLPLLVQGARNPKVIAGGPGELNASKALDRILEVPSGNVDRSQGDIHPLGNPHYLLDPRNGLKVAALIADKLKELDPANAAVYEQNRAAYEKKLSTKISEWEKAAAPLKGLEVVEYHKGFEYLADWLGLKVEDYLENKPGIPASPQHKQELIKMMQQKKIPLILVATYNPPHDAEEVARQTGAKVATIPAAVEGEPGVDSYLDLFDHIVKELLAASGK